LACAISQNKGITIMTIKGFTEHRGIASRITFDHVTGQFTQTPMPHPFLAVLETIVDTGSCVVTQLNPKSKRPQRASLPASAC
jgi:hypothetical protein